MNQFRVECSVVNYFTFVFEADTAYEARELAHADINSHKIIKEWVSDWEINLITEVN